MRKPKHKREAIVAKRQEALNGYLEAKANGTLERSKGYRLSPNLLTGYRFNNPMNAKGSQNKKGYDTITKVIDYRDASGELKQFKYRTHGKTNVTDSELYSNAKPVRHERGEVRVRVGTTPSRLVKIVIDGEEKVVRLKPQPKWQDVGLVSCNPKDGGK